MDNNNFIEAGIRPNRFLYQGKEWQTELGLNLYNFHARQFDPALGRFLSVDPQNQFGSPYLGMGNLPTITVDPDGELAWLAAALFGAKAILDYSNARQNGLNGFQSFLYAGLNLALSAAVGDVSGALPNALLHAGVNVASNGVSNIALGQPFFNNWQFSAIVGGVTGGIRGHGLAGKDPYRNNWTGGRNWKAIRANQPKVSWPAIEPSQVSLKGVGGLPRPETTTLPKAIDFNAIFG